MPSYEAKNSGLFELKETYNEKTQWSGTQTLVTPKSRETALAQSMGWADKNIQKYKTW